MSSVQIKLFRYPIYNYEICTSSYGQKTIRMTFFLSLLIDCTMMYRAKYDLRTIKWSTVSPKSNEGEKSPNQVKCLERRKSNLELKFLETSSERINLQF
jgi:hypothetical protein